MLLAPSSAQGDGSNGDNKPFHACGFATRTSWSTHPSAYHSATMRRHFGRLLSQKGSCCISGRTFCEGITGLPIHSCLFFSEQFCLGQRPESNFPPGTLVRELVPSRAISTWKAESEPLQLT